MRIRSEIAKHVVLWESAEAVEIGISAARRPLQALFLAAWLVGWGYALLEVASELEMPIWPDNVLPLLWLAVWILAGLFVAYRLLESLFGRETVIAGPTDVRVAYKSLGIGRSHTYPLAELSNLRLATAADRGQRPRRARRGALAFDHRGDPVVWGRALKSAEAQRILEKLTLRFPSLGPGRE